MTILSEGEVPAAPSRHQLRLDRQARVGILRNLHEPPRLPPRKAPLTGKWLDMRSRRRLQRDGLDPLVLPAARPGQADAAGPGAVECPRPFSGATVPAEAAEDSVAARLRRNLRELSAEAQAAQMLATASPPDDTGAARPDGPRGASAGGWPRVATGLLAGLAVALAAAALVAVWISVAG